jgi:sulfur-carrier protein
MITLKFFGKLGDLVGESMEVPCEKAVAVTDIINSLADSHPALYREITAPQVMVAVNQTIVAASHAVHQGDEVAFLPPVTGG